MGLFDFGGGGFDPSQLLNFLQPSAAQAANTMSPESKLTEDQLFNYAAQNQTVPNAGLPAPITQPQTRTPQPSPAPAPSAPEPVPAQAASEPAAFRMNPPGVVTNDQRAESGIAPDTALKPSVSDVGAALSGNAASTGRQVGGGSASSETAPSDANAQAPESGLKRPDANTLAGALRGVKAPEAPAFQKISSPNAPHLNPIKSGNLAALLALLNAGGGRGLPTTLGRG